MKPPIANVRHGRRSFLSMRSCALSLFLAGASLCPLHAAPNPQKIAEHAQSTMQDQRGSASNPISVKLVDPQKSPEQIQEEQSEKAEKRTNDAKAIQLTENIVDLTKTLVYVGIGQALIFVLQLIVFGFQARQLTRTVDTTVKESQPVLSPYVVNMDDLHELHVPSTTVEFNGKIVRESAILFSFENYGKTPGIVRHVRADLFLTERDEIPKVDPWTLPIHHYEQTVPGQTNWENLSQVPAIHLKKSFAFTSTELQELLGEAVGNFRRYFLVGLVIYDDFFGNRHTRHFCIKLRLAQGVRFQAQHGGAKCNSTKREKIPRNDPLDKVAT